MVDLRRFPFKESVFGTYPKIRKLLFYVQKKVNPFEFSGRDLVYYCLVGWRESYNDDWEGKIKHAKRRLDWPWAYRRRICLG